MAKMVRVKVTKLYELTVELEPGTFLTVPQGCTDEVPLNDEVKAALANGLVEEVTDKNEGGRRKDEPEPGQADEEPAAGTEQDAGSGHDPGFGEPNAGHVPRRKSSRKKK